MNITKIGEFGLIQRFRKLIKTDSSVIKGAGDDCAVLRFNKDKYLLFTCDMLAEGVDFTPRDSPYLIGRKAIAVSISDIAACAGLPRYCLVSLATPKNTPLEFVDRLFKGMLDIAKKYNIKTAILKSNSPACGSGRIYDGTFNRALVKGDGVLAALLIESGLRVYTEKDNLLDKVPR